MNILSIDSSTRFLSVGVSRDGRLLSEVNDRGKSGHMVNIMGMAESALRGAKLALKDIDVFGVNEGPGDFTGTRIGVSVIKTLSWLESKPAFGINFLDSHALGMCLGNSSYIVKSIKENIPVMVMPCLDVRKEEVYFSFYEIGRESGNGSENDDDYIAEIRQKKGNLFVRRKGRRFLTRYDNLRNVLNAEVKNGFLKKTADSSEKGNLRIIMGGNCYISYPEVISGIAGKSKIFILDKKEYLPRADYLNVCAYYRKAMKVETRNLIPVYVREFIPFGGDG
ncbi:MAG: tRNA (adenosine(37)-N6)-threonylcarbamoyltransferase complex dimerization subunit type 1 TsaB [Actinomycetota bacterium]|nr:tRNA (adenosine(37)-N6)-threonylcarbamoyltransferase complex dimerization subunit type 1 TsaB [Actinomycetota bacterium]